MELHWRRGFDPLMMAGLVERDGGIVKLASDRLAGFYEVFGGTDEMKR